MTGKLHLREVMNEKVDLSEHRLKTLIDHSKTNTTASELRIYSHFIYKMIYKAP